MCLLERTGLELPSLTSEAIVRAARKRAGCDDLGGESFREPLDHYLQSDPSRWTPHEVDQFRVMKLYGPVARDVDRLLDPLGLTDARIQHET